MTEAKDVLESPLFKAVTDLAFDSIMVTEATDDQGASKIVAVNQRFTDMTGYSAAEVMGQTPGLLQGPETDKAVTDQLAEDLRQGRTFHGKTVNYRKDGSAFDIEWKVAPVKHQGEVTHYVAVQRDVSSQPGSH